MWVCLCVYEFYEEISEEKVKKKEMVRVKTATRNTDATCTYLKEKKEILCHETGKIRALMYSSAIFFLFCLGVAIYNSICLQKLKANNLPGATDAASTTNISNITSITNTDSPTPSDVVNKADAIVAATASAVAAAAAAAAATANATAANVTARNILRDCTCSGARFSLQYVIPIYMCILVFGFCLAAPWRFPRIRRSLKVVRLLLQAVRHSPDLMPLEKVKQVVESGDLAAANNLLQNYVDGGRLLAV